MIREPLNLTHRFFERYRYAIVDAARREDIPDSWPMAPIAPAFLGSDTSRCPLLIDCLGIPETERHGLLDRLAAETKAKDEAFVSLALASPVGFKSLQRHLAERLVIRNPADNQLRQFRYYDPGTFVQLPDVLGSPGMSWLLGPIESVAVSWLGEWCHYTNTGTDSALFNLTHHYNALLNLSVINRVLTQLPEVRNQREWRDKGNTLRSIVDQARSRYGLSLRDDLVAFVMHAVQWHPAFDRHPILQKLLARLAAALPEDELDYCELTGRLEEADWQRITQDMQAATTAEGVKP